MNFQYILIVIIFLLFPSSVQANAMTDEVRSIALWLIFILLLPIVFITIYFVKKGDNNKDSDNKKNQ